MALDFDPYFKWLGIPPGEQPPNHYRLLAIPLFTSDPEVIENAADQRMAHLRSVQSGQRAAPAQALLNQIAMAKVCLLDRAQKSAYDQSLQHSLAPPIAAPPVHFEVEPPLLNQGAVRSTTAQATIRRTVAPTTELIKIVLGGIAGLVFGYMIICWISPRSDFLGIMATNKATEESRPKPTPVVTVNTNPEPVVITKKNLEQIDPVIEKPQTKEHPGKSVPTPTTPEQTPEPVIIAPVPVDKQAQLAAERDAAVETGDLAAALRAARELAILSKKSDLEEQLFLLSVWNAESPTTRREVASQLAKLLEQAIAEDKLDLAAQHVDQLLVLARSLDDQELVRQATLIALKRSAGLKEPP